jgi:hypothetical protein
MPLPALPPQGSTNRYSHYAAIDNAVRNGVDLFSDGGSRGNGDVVDVRNFGAVGDGETDDTAAINAAPLPSRRPRTPSRRPVECSTSRPGGT